MFKLAISAVALFAITAPLWAVVKAKPKPKPKPRVAVSRRVVSRQASSRQVASRPVATRHSTSRSKRAVRPVRYVAPAQPSPDRYKEIQQALASKGYYKGEVSGSWNAESVAALKRFQAEQSLPSDGKLNSLSLIALGLGPKRLTAQAQPVPHP